MMTTMTAATAATEEDKAGITEKIMASAILRLITDEEIRGIAIKQLGPVHCGIVLRCKNAEHAAEIEKKLLDWLIGKKVVKRSE